MNISQTESKTTVIIRRSDTMAIITIPLSFDISKNTNKQILASGGIYLSSKGWHCNTSFTSKRTNTGSTFHDYFDTLKIVKKILDPYIVKMQLNNIDSLNLGTIQELKRADSTLLDNLMKGDSIAFDFYYDEVYNPIVLPIEVK